MPPATHGRLLSRNFMQTLNLHSRCPIAARLAAAVCLAALGWSCPALAAGNAWYEGFEGPNVSWRDAGGDARYRIVQQQRVRQVAHTGEGCEWVQLQGENGTAVYLSHDVGRPRVIDDLIPSVWLKSDRAGMQLLARVVLPHSIDEKTGQPLAVILAGNSYANLGRWQQLRIDDMPKLLARQLWTLRMQRGANVDGREAYVESVLLNVYGGPGATNVWIDDLDIAGYVAMPVSAQGAAGETRPPPMRLGDLPPASPKRAITAASESHRVQLSGSILMVDSRPFFPRAIQYRGERMADLRKLGFNTVWLDRLPPPELLDEAASAGLWVICPPPRPARLDAASEPVAALPEIGPEYNSVLVWDLGQGLSEAELEPTRRWAEEVRLADRQGARPLICRAETNVRAYSRHTDLMLIDRRPLGTTLELTDYGEWIRRQPRLARPGTPVWTTVQTQPSAAAREQLRVIDPSREPPAVVADEQLRLLVYVAVASGSRGLLVLSDTPLTATDPETRQRAMSLELLNLELDLIEPWAAAGTFMTTADCSETQVIGAVLRIDRARLLMPLWSAPGTQFVPAQSAANGVTLTVPGAPEATNVYELTPGGMHALRHKRITGGTRVTLDEFGLTDLCVLAQDPLIVNSLAKRSSVVGPRAAELERNLVARKLQVVQDVTGRLASRAVMPTQAGDWIRAAEADLQRCDGRLAAKDYPAAYTEAMRAGRALRLLERACWEKSISGLASPIASPGAIGFTALPWHRQLVERVASARLGPNRLACGDFENIDAMVQAGWRHQQHPTGGVRTLVELVPAAAHSGASGLRIAVRAEQADAAPALVESPPVWITSAPVQVEAGQLICIHGWLKIPGPLTGSVDGLMIVDSLSGDSLALRYQKTTEWQRFLVYRLAPQSGLMNVTFAMTGLGEVYLDDLVVQTLDPLGRSALPVPAAGLPPGAGAWRSPPSGR